MDFQEQLRLLNKRKAELFGEKAVTPEGTARLYGALFDEGTFVELNALAAQGGCVTGYGLVDDLPAYLIAQDDQVDGGAMSQAQAKRITNAIDKAMAVAAPVVLVINSQGAKVTEGAAVLHAYTEVFTRLQMMDGLSPRIAVINGPCVGVAAHFAALCDISIAVDGKAQLLSAPTSVLEAVHGAAKDSKTWGSASVLAQQGAVALAASDTAAALKTVRELLLLLPSSVYSEPVRDVKDDMNRLLTDSAMENGLKLAKMVADKRLRIESTAVNSEALLPGGPFDLWADGDKARFVKDLVGAFAATAKLPKMLNRRAILETLLAGCEAGDDPEVGLLKFAAVAQQGGQQAQLQRPRDFFQGGSQSPLFDARMVSGADSIGTLGSDDGADDDSCGLVLLSRPQAGSQSPPEGPPFGLHLGVFGGQRAWAP